MRLRAIEKLREARLWIVPTLSPLGMWNDLSGTLKQFKSWQIPYMTTLFFKQGIAELVPLGSSWIIFHSTAQSFRPTMVGGSDGRDTAGLWRFGIDWSG